MNILIVSTPFIPVPPITYGGLERVIYDLATSLHELGVRVTVACPTQSSPPVGVELLDIGPARYQFQQDWVSAERKAYDLYKGRLEDFDLIHDHTWYAFPYLAKRYDNSLKVIHTHHGHLSWKSPPPVAHPNLVAISQYMAASYSPMLGVAVRVVYNGVALDEYKHSSTRGERLLYLGRIVKFKQPHIAIDIAKRAGVPIDIVGGDRFVDDLQYVARIKGSCDGLQACYVGEASQDTKIKYLQNCRAVVIPSRMGEPFGLVAVEALATGRPVVCLGDGALPEIVSQSVGFVCANPDEMISVIRGGLDLRISSDDCRRRAEEFSRTKMAEEYSRLYDDIREGKEW